MKVKVKVDGGCSWPEFHIPSGMQFVALHVPEVEEWRPLCQSHSTVVPTGIVVVLVPLTESVN